MRDDAAVDASALPQRMHAVRVHQFGGLDALVYEEVPRPVPGAGQVLVRVKAARAGVRAVFFLVAVTSAGLRMIADLLDAGQLATHVGEVLPLSDACLAHEMLAGKPHKRGKIVLAVET